MFEQWPDEGESSRLTRTVSKGWLAMSEHTPTMVQYHWFGWPIVLLATRFQAEPTNWYPTAVTVALADSVPVPTVAISLTLNWVSVSDPRNFCCG